MIKPIIISSISTSLCDAALDKMGLVPSAINSLELIFFLDFNDHSNSHPMVSYYYLSLPQSFSGQKKTATIRSPFDTYLISVITS